MICHRSLSIFIEHFIDHIDPTLIGFFFLDSPQRLHRIIPPKFVLSCRRELQKRKRLPLSGLFCKAHIFALHVYLLGFEEEHLIILVFCRNLEVRLL